MYNAYHVTYCYGLLHDLSVTVKQVIIEQISANCCDFHANCHISERINLYCLRNRILPANSSDYGILSAIN